MTDKERASNEVVDQILAELRQQREQAEAAPAPVEEIFPEPRLPDPAPPAQEKPAPGKVEEIFPEPRLPEHHRTIATAEELIDDRFRDFFTTSVAMDKKTIARLAEEEREERRRKSLLGRLFSRRDEDDEDDDDYEDLVEPDAYLEDDEDDEPVKTLPADIFAGEDAPAPEKAPAPAEPAREEEEEDEWEEEAPKKSFWKGLFGRKAAEEDPDDEEEADLTDEPEDAEAEEEAEEEKTPALPADIFAPEEPAPAKEPEPEQKEAPAEEPEEKSAPAQQPAAGDTIAFDPVRPSAAAPAVEQATIRFEAIAAAVAEQAELAIPAETAEISEPAEEAESAEKAEEPETVTIFAPAPGADLFEDDSPTRELDELPGAQPEEEEPEELEEETEEAEPIRDYESPEDAPAVEEDLKSLKGTLALRTLLTGLLTVFLLYITLAKTVDTLPVMAFMDPFNQPMVYLGVCLVLTLICAAVNWPTLSGGILSVKGEPNPDIAPAFALVFTLVQLAVFMTDSKAFAAGDLVPFCGIAAAAVTANTVGKLLTVRVVADNFRLASNGCDHAAAFRVEDETLSRRVTAGLGEKEPHLLVSRPTALVRGFLQQSFSAHPTDRTARLLGILAAAAGLVSGIAVMLLTGDGLSAVSCAAGAVCLATPLASTLLGAVPTALMQAAAARVGAVIPGPSAVEELRDTNVVLITAKDLFPAGTVKLRGIKTFRKERIDLAILYAASILVEGCTTMRDIFLGVVEGKREMLYKVENLSCETGRGFVGWIDGQRVIVGGRSIMEKYDVEIPSMDYEYKYTGDEKKPVYLAVSGRLFGMFLVSYGPAGEMMDTVDDMRAAGLSLLVRSDDFCVDAALISRCYGIPADSVKVLNEAELAALEPTLGYLPASEGVMTHLGSFSSYVGGLNAAMAAAAAEKTAGMVQVASVAMAILLTALLTFTAGLGRLSVLAVALYQLAWLILTLAAPLLKKY